MNDVELETLLRESAPEVSTPAGFAAHQERILRDARIRTGRRLRRWGASLGISVLLIGGGSAAMAGAGMETPWGWVADNVFSFSNSAEMCFAGMQVKFEGVSENSDIVREARDFVGTIDVATLDTSRALAELIAENRTATDGGGQLSPIEMSDATLRQMAISRTISTMLWAHLEDAGYPMDPSPISFYTRTQGCNE